MSPEVLIYIQSIRNYFDKNIEAKNYFLNKIDEKIFFKFLSEVSQKNFEKEGEATLTSEQFELIRETLIMKTMFNETNEMDANNHLFFNTNGFGRIYLN